MNTYNAYESSIEFYTITGDSFIKMNILVVNGRLSFLNCQLLYPYFFNGMHGEGFPTANLIFFFRE
jgi:hypothetical protein